MISSVGNSFLLYTFSIHQCRRLLMWADREPCLLLKSIHSKNLQFSAYVSIVVLGLGTWYAHGRCRYVEPSGSRKYSGHTTCGRWRDGRRWRRYYMYLKVYMVCMLGSIRCTSKDICYVCLGVLRVFKRTSWRMLQVFTGVPKGYFTAIICSASRRKVLAFSNMLLGAFPSVLEILYGVFQACETHVLKRHVFKRKSYPAGVPFEFETI